MWGPKGADAAPPALGDASAHETQLRQIYAELGSQQATEFDKRLMWISAGALVLVSAYAPQIRATLHPWGVALLVIAGLVLAAALLSTLWSFQVGIKDIQDFLEAPSEKRGKLQKERARRMYRINTVNLTLTGIGLILMITFMATTLYPTGGEVKKMEDKTQPATPETTDRPVRIKEGTPLFIPPSPPPEPPPSK